jgi:hypothetical protein
MSTSKKKVAANRINGQKSQGPTNTTSTRFNATKHGLLAVGITELDDADGYHSILGDLMRERNPVGKFEMSLIEAAALDVVRLPRARRLEAEYITGELNPPTRGPSLRDVLGGDDVGQVIDPGLPAAITAEAIQRMVTFQRYETSISLRLFRTLHELERYQSMRRGDRVPAPVIVDVNVRSETRIGDPVPDQTRIVDPVRAEACSEKSVPASPAKTRIVDSVHAETGKEESVPAASERLKSLPEDEG